jgi:HEAT repeat protein
VIHLITWVAVSLAGVLALLVATIVARRFFAARRRKRERAMRPAIEAGIAEYLADPEAEPPLPSASRGERELTRVVGLEALAELQGAERRRLVTLLERSGIVADTVGQLRARRARARRAAAESLSQIGSLEGVQPMLRGLQDSDVDVRLSCASGLAELGDEAYAQPILVAANAAATERPGAAAAALVTLGRKTPSALAYPLDGTLEVCPELRRVAAAVVGELRLIEHAPLLRDALESDDPELVANAVRGLGRIGDVEATDALVRLIDARQPDLVRLTASEALGALGNPAAVKPLERELLSSDNWRRQSAAAQALRRLGGAGEEALRRARESPTETVRAHAGVALDQ